LAAVVARALEKQPDKRFASAAEFAQALKPYAGAGKSFTAMMPKGTAAQVAAYQEIPAAAQELPAVPIVASKPSEPIRGPASSVPKPVKMTPVGPLPAVAPTALPATTPEGHVPEGALKAARKKAQPSPLLLVGIAAGCLVAGVVITMVALRLFG